jgi:hypothetical protein
MKNFISHNKSQSMTKVSQLNLKSFYLGNYNPTLSTTFEHLNLEVITSLFINLTLYVTENEFV